MLIEEIQINKKYRNERASALMRDSIVTVEEYESWKRKEDSLSLGVGAEEVENEVEHSILKYSYPHEQDKDLKVANNKSKAAISPPITPIESTHARIFNDNNATGKAEAGKVMRKEVENEKINRRAFTSPRGNPIPLNRSEPYGIHGTQNSTVNNIRKIVISPVFGKSFTPSNKYVTSIVSPARTYRWNATLDSPGKERRAKQFGNGERKEGWIRATNGGGGEQENIENGRERSEEEENCNNNGEDNNSNAVGYDRSGGCADADFNLYQHSSDDADPSISTFEKNRRVFGAKLIPKSGIKLKIPVTKKIIAQQIHLLRYNGNGNVNGNGNGNGEDKENFILQQQIEREQQWNSNVAIVYKNSPTKSPILAGFYPSRCNSSSQYHTAPSPPPSSSPAYPPKIISPQKLLYQSSPPKTKFQKNPSRLLDLSLPSSPTPSGNFKNNHTPNSDVKASPKKKMSNLNYSSAQTTSISAFQPSLKSPIILKSPNHPKNSMSPKSPKSPISLCTPRSPQSPLSPVSCHEEMCDALVIPDKGLGPTGLSDQKRLKSRLAKSALNRWHQRYNL